MDVRDGIRYFKEEIISRVTSNIFRRVQKWNIIMYIKIIFNNFQYIF
jgi:hypothetical protein